MNYFEFYEIPVQFHPDQDEIKKKFYVMSKKYHPDFYIGQPSEKQEEMLELSTLNNKAFQVLRNDQQRLHYLLTLKGQLTEGEHYTLPPAFLMEMMDINEAIMELEFEADAAKQAGIIAEVQTIETALNAELNRLTLLFDKGNSGKEVLTAIKDIYYRKKYIDRIKENLSS